MTDQPTGYVTGRAEGLPTGNGGGLCFCPPPGDPHCPNCRALEEKIAGLEEKLAFLTGTGGEDDELAVRLARALDLPAAPARMALILCRAQYGLGRDILVRRMWPDGAPKSASTMIAGYVRQLRARLGQDAIATPRQPKGAFENVFALTHYGRVSIYGPARRVAGISRAQLWGRG